MLCVAAWRCAATSGKASEAPGGDGWAPILVPKVRAVAAGAPPDAFVSTKLAGFCPTIGTCLPDTSKSADPNEAGEPGVLTSPVGR